MEEVVGSVMFASAFDQKRVWLSGHTGFKGGWLAEWLLALGSEVRGFALAPTATQPLFKLLALESRLDSQFGDIRDAGAVDDSLRSFRPDFVFHLAAQPLVRQSFELPIETFGTNVMGTVHVLDALRRLDQPCAAVIVTTDKCYENRSWIHGYREDDPMGGHDPYSASKGMAELAVSSYRRSFFTHHSSGVAVASARAGNVIGGGDFAPDRILPDAVRSNIGGRPLRVRNSSATRPWQHVLEPLSGYLWLAANLAHPEYAERPERLREGFNFGPELASNRTVAELVTEFLKTWPGTWDDYSDPMAVHEASLLNLAIDKAHHVLGWRPVWNFSETVARAAAWYRQYHGGISARSLVLEDLNSYRAAATALGLRWAR